MRVVIRRTIFFAVLPVIFALYLHETWTFVSHWVSSRCLVTPSTRSSAVNCLNRSGFDALPYHPQFENFPIEIGGERLTPLAGVPHATTLFCKEAGAWQTFESDKVGFSNPDSVWKESALDAVVLGDSFALGECVSRSVRAVSVVQSVNPRVLNLGYSSSSLLTHYARFIEYAKRRKPRHTFLFYYEGNDPLELLGESRHPIWGRYLEEKNYSQHLEENRVVIGNVLRPWLKNYVEMGDPYYVSFEFLPFLRLNNTFRMIKRARNPQASASLYKMTGGEDVPLARDFLALSGAIFKALRRETARWGGKAYLVYLPSFREEERGFYPAIRKRSRSAGVNFIDMEASFKRHGINPYTDTWPNHYTVEANQHLGKTLLSVIGGRGAEMGAGPGLRLSHLKK